MREKGDLIGIYQVRDKWVCPSQDIYIYTKKKKKIKGGSSSHCPSLGLQDI